MNAAKLRDYYQQSQLILSELQAVGADAYGRDRANAKHQNLVCLALRLKLGAESITDKDSRTIWLERSIKLHHDLLTLTALRLQGDEQSAENTWDGFLGLLYAGSVSYLALEKECADLREEIDAQKRHEGVLEERIQETAKQREVSAGETLALRTRVLVQQQDVQQREADARELQQHWQAVVQERDRLRVEKETLAQEFARSSRECDRQTVVIKQMMERSESSGKEREEAVATLAQVDEDNHVLRVNLHQHTLVVEKLIGLNSEMMDASNSKSLLCEQLRSEIKQKDEENKVAALMISNKPSETKTSLEATQKNHKEEEEEEKEEAVPLSHPPSELSRSQTRSDRNRDQNPDVSSQIDQDISQDLATPVSTPVSSVSSSHNGTAGWGPRYWAQITSRPDSDAVKSCEARLGEEEGGGDGKKGVGDGRRDPSGGSSCSSTNEEQGNSEAMYEEDKREAQKVPRDSDVDIVKNNEAKVAIAETSREASPSDTRSERGENLGPISGGEEEGDAGVVIDPKRPFRLKANLHVAKGLVRNVGGKAKGWMRYIAGDD